MAVLSVAARAASFWQRYDIRRIEDLENAVLGGDLEAIQMTGPRVHGSLAFAARSGIVLSTGLIHGKAAIRGMLARDAVTIAIALSVGPGSRHWLNEVRTGDIGVFLPESEHDAIYSDGSLYVAVTLTQQRLEEEAGREGFASPETMLAKTGLHATPIDARPLSWMRQWLMDVHAGDAIDPAVQHELRRQLLRTILAHYDRFPDSGDGRHHPQARALIVAQALAFIRENLSASISVDVLARATGTPHRTLHRAFLEVLDETPQGFVRRLRLHRIRRELVAGIGPVCGIGAVARECGVAHTGRLASRYRSVFGEKPSVTLAVHRERYRAGMQL